eukprot:4739843-Amphidinium_carterae.1
MQTYDQLNLPSIAAAEQIARRVLMTERAVRKNPKNPEFDGLELYLSHSLDSSGGVVTSAFDQHISKLKEVDARVWKHERMWRDEREQESKRGQGGGGQNAGGKKAGAAKNAQAADGLGVGAGSATCAGRRAGRRLAVRRR